MSLTSLNAQHFGQIGMGRYAGIHAARINPALMANSKYIWHVNLIGCWINANASGYQFNPPYNGNKPARSRFADEYFRSENKTRLQQSWFKGIWDGKDHNAGLSSMLYGPSFMVRVKKFKVGLITDINSQVRIDGMSANLSRAVFNRMDSARGAFSSFGLNAHGQSDRIAAFTAAQNQWSSIGITGAYIIPMKWKRDLHVGATIKSVRGLGGSYVQSDEIQATRIAQGVYSLDRTRIQMAEYTSGRGTGLDLGFAYTIRKKEHLQPGDYKFKHPDYMVHLGLSFMDIGSILYRDVKATTFINAATAQWNAAGVTGVYQPVPDVKNVQTILAGLPGGSTFTQNLRIGLPTRMVWSADYQFKRHWFIQSQWVQSMRSKYGNSMRHASYMMVGPRYESDLFAFTLPVMLEYDYRSIRPAASMRIGPIYIGTNSLLSAVRTRNVKDLDYFIGISFGDIPGSWIDRQGSDKEEKEKIKRAQSCDKM
ncbi:MAG: DUF5723 family protein [Sphingomonadales bacterium]